MDKQAVRHVVFALLPFTVILAMWRALNYFFAKLLEPSLATLVAFIVSSGVAVLLYHLLAGGIESKHEKEKTPVWRDILHVFVIFSPAIAAMYLVVGVFADGVSDEPLTLVGVLSAIVVHPIIEEYVFRRLIYGELREMNPVFGILSQAVMFALVHNTIGGMIYALFCGIILGVGMEKTNRLWVTILAHMLINTRSLLYSAGAVPAFLIPKIDTALIAAGILIFAILVISRHLSEVIKPDASENPDEEN